MHSAEWIKKYNRLNSAFEKKVVFRLGSEAGFFSEFNNMALAILYCLQNRIKFSLSSKDGNFSYRKGWQDYFLEFCQESESNIHLKHNKRINKYVNIRQNILIRIYRFVTRTKYFTQDIWPLLRDYNFFDSAFDIRELGIQGDVFQALRIVVNNIWNLRPDVKDLIYSRKKQLNLPKEYIGLHIRGGDKISEANLYDVDAYIDKVRSVSSCKVLFIATDDYNNVLKINSFYPEYKTYTLVSESAKGFKESAYNMAASEQRKEMTLALLVDVELLAEASIFIGTYSSNIGMFMGLRRDIATCYGLDFECWRVW